MSWRQNAIHRRASHGKPNSRVQPQATKKGVTLETKVPEKKSVDLTEAAVIVSGGRGLKGPEHFHLVEELAAV